MEEDIGNCSFVYKWGEWPLENCAIEAYFGIGFHRNEICNHFKTYDTTILHIYYVLSMLPYFFALTAVITNLIFIYIGILVLKNRNNPSRNLYTFLLTRSISVLILQVIGLAMNLLYDSRLSIIFFTSSSFFCILVNIQTYLILSIFTYASIAYSKWYNEKVVMKNCIILNGIIWASSTAITFGFGLTSYLKLFSKSEENCNFDNCEKPFAIFTVYMCIIIYIFAFKMTAIFGFALFKLKRHQIKTEENVKIQSKQNLKAMKRLLYNILLFVLTRSPFLILCILLLITIDSMEVAVSCKELYDEILNFELFLNIAITMAMLGMITDPLITIWNNFSMIRKLFRKSLN